MSVLVLAVAIAIACNTDVVKAASPPILPAVVKFADLYIDGSRDLNIYKCDEATFTCGSSVDSIAIRDGKESQTSDILAYRPHYNAYHNTGLGAVFVNLNKLYPCAASASLQPVCHLYPQEDDGFDKGKAIIEAADRGNDIKIFGSKVYGFVFQGCPELSGSDGCLPTYYEKVLVCYLPQTCA